MTETQLVRLCVSYLLVKGHYCWRNNTGATRASYTDKDGRTKQRYWRAGIRGSSDILGVSKDGRFIAIECKVGKNKTTPHQELFLQEIKSRGGIALVAYDVDDLKGVL